MGLTDEQQAFILVCGAGCSTFIGAAVVFSDRLVNLANGLFLAGVVSFAAGVMLFVSMIEIFVKSNTGFSDSGYSEGVAYAYTTLSFFGGVCFYMLLDLAVHCIERLGNKGNNVDIADSEAMMGITLRIAETKRRAENESTEEVNDLKSAIGNKIPDSEKITVRTGFMLAIAIGIHNFPEGLATFVGTLADPVVGAALAVAIGIHNIPEGLCIAIPVYYATGNRYKAFLWAILSGITEPIGAGLGWLILKDHFDDRIYGVVFGLVSGMMVIICLKELIPTAVRYDPKDKVTTKSLVAGMVVMATSLVLFVY